MESKDYTIFPWKELLKFFIKQEIEPRSTVAGCKNKW